MFYPKRRKPLFLLINCGNIILKNSYCKKVNTKKYSHTIFIPKSSMPTHRKPSYEQELLKSPKFKNLYADQSKRSGEKFILHDGPPYANGSIHFGHVINKTLKDIVCRRRVKQGRPVSFIPGWDCHGLPIELKVYQEHPELMGVDPVRIREEAQNQAHFAIQNQRESFCRLGVMADWENPYLTLSNDAIVKQLRAFYQLCEKDLIFRDSLPVYFSPSSLTTLAESELEYNPKHISPAVYVAFPVTSKINELELAETIYAVIWTTTPWTLFGNQAIAYKPGVRYCLVYAPRFRQNLIVATELVNSLRSVFQTELVLKDEISAMTMPEITYRNPLASDHDLPFVRGDHVTTEKGTGLVHIAPNHGREDFQIALDNDLSTDHCVVDDDGKYVEGIHSNLAGESVLTKGNELALEMFSSYILHKEDYVHSYPYDWRTRQPVLTKTSRQWFLDLDPIRDECLSELAKVTFYPDGIKHKIANDIIKRPPWCISRQRVWGVPIPAFFSRQDREREDPIITRRSINHLCQLVEREGMNCWWLREAKELLPQSLLEHENLHIYGVEKSNDIFDVWFDSGLTWNSVLSGDKISDVYLEGIDQSKGWFQSSLILSVALRKISPYKRVYVHGFAVDADGRKMSKSVGNVVDPVPLLNEQFGADVLRFYVAKYATHHGNLPIDLNSLKNAKKEVDQIRGKLRFCLGALEGFTDPVEYDSLRFVDKYMLALLHQHSCNWAQFYEHYNLQTLAYDIIEFVDKISSFYIKVTKDRLYCNEKNSVGRRACQTVIKHCLDGVMNALCPITPFLTEELAQFLNPESSDTSYFLREAFESSPTWCDESIITKGSIVCEAKKLLESGTDDTKHLTKPYDIYIHGSNENLDLLKDINSEESETGRTDLAEILQVVRVILAYSKQIDSNSSSFDKILQSEETSLRISLKQTNLVACQRCLLHLSDKIDELCPRCLKLCGDEMKKMSLIGS
ncbi:isoleucyl-tRNA synthetase, mitochondrial [Brevipalpus obovatus]|uniref:isoleucyl-tRNA synthetase, mitochondrial n=1 Tax=Brevipalpus obovatus TaxID=246614 RepID=UPI003D9F678E